VQARKWGNSKELCYNLPEPLPTRIHTFIPENAAGNSNFTECWATPNDAEKW